MDRDWSVTFDPRHPTFGRCEKAGHHVVVILDLHQFEVENSQALFRLFGRKAKGAQSLDYA